MLEADGFPDPDYRSMEILQQFQDWQELTSFSDGVISRKPEWLTPYLYRAVGLINLNRGKEAVPLLERVRDDSGGDPNYSLAADLLENGPNNRVVRTISHNALDGSHSFLADHDYQTMARLEESQNWRGLIEASQTISARRPSWPMPYLMEAVASLRLKDIGTALDRFKQVRGMAGNDPDYRIAAEFLGGIGVQ